MRPYTIYSFFQLCFSSGKASRRELCVELEEEESTQVCTLSVPGGAVQGSGKSVGEQREIYRIKSSNFIGTPS